MLPSLNLFIVQISVSAVFEVRLEDEIILAFEALEDIKLSPKCTMSCSSVWPNLIILSMSTSSCLSGEPQAQPSGSLPEDFLGESLYTEIHSL